VAGVATALYSADQFDVESPRRERMRDTPMKRLTITALLVGAIIWIGCAGGSATDVKLTWDPVPGVVGYNVYRSTQSGGDYERINPAPLPQPRHVDDDVEVGKTYFYRVTAVDAAGVESEYSEERSRTVR